MRTIFLSLVLTVAALGLAAATPSSADARPPYWGGYRSYYDRGYYGGSYYYPRRSYYRYGGYRYPNYYRRNYSTYYGVPYTPYYPVYPVVPYYEPYGAYMPSYYYGWR